MCRNSFISCRKSNNHRHREEPHRGDLPTGQAGAAISLYKSKIASPAARNERIAERVRDTCGTTSSLSIQMIKFAVIIALAVYSHTAWAEEVQITSLEPATLAGFEQELLAKNPDLRAAEARWKAAKKRIIQSWALPDPMAGMDIMGEMTETRVGPQDRRFSISQDIPFPVKLWKRRQAAKHEAKAFQQEYEALKREMLTKLRQSVYELYYVDASLGVIQEIQDLLGKAEGVARARYQNRQGTQRDVAKAQAEFSLTLEKIYRLKQAREVLTARINALLDRNPLSELGEIRKPEKPELTQTLPELITMAAKNRQEILAMEAWLANQKDNLTLARLEQIPDLKAGFVYTSVGSGSTGASNDGQDSWMFPLMINVPLWQNRILPAISESKQKVIEAEANLESTLQETYYEVRDAYSRFDTGSRVALLYETAVIPQADIALKSDQAGYEGGATDFLNLLDSERIYLTAQLDYLRIYTDTLQSYEDLIRATGMDLEGGRA